MATPLYKKMKRGTSFYAFPNAIHDLNVANMNDSVTMSFSKYMLLNIPEQDVVIESGVDRDQTKGTLNFDKDSEGPLFYNFQPGKNSNLPIKFSEQLIESLRNYVSNYDTILRESRINTNTDFYNVNETTTPTEMIFWKWCKKYNLIDLEPATHKIDWDKNLPDFKNKNGTDTSYFQQYLWKERETINYICDVVDVASNLELSIDTIAKFKVGDKINITGITELTEDEYIVGEISYLNSRTTIVVYGKNIGVSGIFNGGVNLIYHRLVEAIGDVQSVSQVQTSRHNFTDVSIQIPHHAGSTPTILFKTESNTNYYPGLEMPILPQEQQVEIHGSENTNSPIRLNPENYPGTYYGYYDTVDKTYKCNIGDRSRYSGDYYGINLTNNIGLDAEDYNENLADFDSKNMDGLKIDFDKTHYMKMNLPEYLIRNFDEFNSAYFDKAPDDYYFNAILWYYDLDDGSGKITTNLFGIEFLNDPNDDDDDCDIDANLITPFRKLVSNGKQDGYSYIFDFNFKINVDNDVLPLSYDPTTIHNQFSFDLYQNILNSNAQIQETFISIVSGYTNIQDDLYDLRSQVMSSTDVSTIKDQIKNLNDLLSLYSTMQIADSDTVQVDVEYTGPYPVMKLNTLNVEYERLIDLNLSDVYKYNDINSGASYVVPVSSKNKTRLNIWNDNNNFNESSSILLNNELNYKQSMDIYISPNISELETKLDIYINYINVSTTTKELMISCDNPIDLIHYDSNNPTNSEFKPSYYTNSNIFTYADSINSTTSTVEINLIHPLFDVDDIIYIDNFYLIDTNGKIVDFSGVYKIISKNLNSISIGFEMGGMIMKSKLKISYYKGWKINILRTGQTNTSTLEDRYLITKELL